MKNFILTKVIFLSLLLGQVPLAIADFEIDLSGYEEGDIPTALFGEKLVIKTESNGKKVNYVSGQGSKNVGKINVALTNLSNSFEIIVDADLDAYHKTAILLLSDNEKQQVGVIFQYHTVKLGFNTEVRLGQAIWKMHKLNSIKLKISGKLAKLYLNGEFVQSSSIEHNITYTTLQINGLSRTDKIFEIKGKGTSSSTTTTPTTASDNCMATYSSNGKLHIPCVTAPNKSGGTSVYDITMQKQQSRGFVFNVDMSSIKPR